MMMFKYQARDDDGALVAGTLQAESRDHVGQLLSEQGLFVIQIAAHSRRERQSRIKARATRNQLSWLMWQLSVMVETGMRLSDALACLAGQASSPMLTALLEQISKDVNEGQSFSAAIAKHKKSFPPSLIALIQASELSGTLGKVLRRCATYLMEDQRVIRRMRGALMYPLFMFTICLAVTIFLLTVILPRFAAVFAGRGATLPAPTRMLMALSESIMAHWAVYIAIVAVIVGSIILFLRSATGRRRRDSLLVSLPGLSLLFNALYQSRAFRAISLMMETHVPMLDSMKVIQQIVPNVKYRELWQEVEEQLEVGERFAGPLFASDLIPDSIAQIVDTGDRSGKLGLAFGQLAEFMEEEYNRKISTAMQFIEPAMILIMGSLVAFIAISLMLPLVRASKVIAG